MTFYEYVEHSKRYRSLHCVAVIPASIFDDSGVAHLRDVVRANSTPPKWHDLCVCVCARTRVLTCVCMCVHTTRIPPDKCRGNAVNRVLIYAVVLVHESTPNDRK